MDDQNLKDLEREQADNKQIGDAFQHLLDTYLSSRHRKKVDIVTKPSTSPVRRTRACADCLANRISCTLSPWHRLPVRKWDWVLPASAQHCSMMW